MKRLRKLISKLIVLTILITGLAVSGAEEKVQFADVPTDAWYNGDLQYILKDSRQIFSGYPDGTFRPGDTLTADMFIKLVVTAMEHKAENGREYWASTYIEKAIEEGYVTLDDVFHRQRRPEDSYYGYKRPITRGDMAQITGRAMESFNNYEFRDPLAISTLIKDYNTIPHSKKSNIIKCYDTGIFTGFPDGEFKADNILTRAEAVAVIRRLIDPSARKQAILPVIPNPSPTPIPVDELNRPAKKELGNGVVEVEGIRFDPETDAAPNGAMRILKAEEFVYVVLEHLKFYEHDGKARVRGYIPELPEGFDWDIAILNSLDKPDDRGLAGANLYTKGGSSPEQKLPVGGNTFDRSLYTNKENIIALVLVCEIKSTVEVCGGRLFISFTDNRYSRYDSLGGHSTVETFDPRGFFKW